MKRKEALHYTGPSAKNANHTSLYEAKSCTHIYTQRRGKGLCQRINSGTRVRGSSPLTLNQELCRPQLENACKGRAWTTDTTANRSDKECKAGACVFYEARDFFFFWWQYNGPPRNMIPASPSTQLTYQMDAKYGHMSTVTIDWYTNGD